MIAEAERQISRQREIVARLERSGRGKSDMALVARNILRALQEAQTTNLADRERLLRKPPRASSGAAPA
jgi:hypothetical protein